MKKIRVLETFGKFWWTNRTDNDPPASNKEFDSYTDCMQNIRDVIGECEIEREKTYIKREESFEGDY